MSALLPFWCKTFLHYLFYFEDLQGFLFLYFTGEGGSVSSFYHHYLSVPTRCRYFRFDRLRAFISLLLITNRQTIDFLDGYLNSSHGRTEVSTLRYSVTSLTLFFAADNPGRIRSKNTLHITKEPRNLFLSLSMP